MVQGVWIWRKEYPRLGDGVVQGLFGGCWCCMLDYEKTNV